MSDLDLGNLRASVQLDDTQFERKYRNVDRLLDDLASRKDPQLKVDAEVDGATRALKVVQDAAEELVKRPYDPQIDVETEKAQAKVDRLERELDILRAMEPTPKVDADIRRAERALSASESRLKALDGLRAEMEVQADTSQAESALQDVADEAADAGDEGGRRAGGNLAGGIIAALATIPIAGAIVGIGKAIGDALLEGLQNEVREDVFSARTGLDEATAARFGRAAGEAYASNWGESIAANMDTARVALQAGLLDPAATQRDAQAVIEQLTGVSDVLGEDIPIAARAAGQMLRTGMAPNAAAAFDILTRGAQVGANASDDLLDTFTEYPALFQRLGLDGQTALGLINQGLQAGARNSDLVADALKEFQIRATDASTASAEGYRLIGLSAEEMTAQIAAGGEGAREGLDLVLDRLRAMEDPVARNVAGVALFGTQWEDMGDAILALDVSTAVEQLGALEGAADSALSTLGDNSAGKIAEAQRNIELAADGIKGALATAFSPQIEGFATFVSQNREAVLQFLLDASNGAIDFARNLVEGAASATEGFGAFVGGPVADLINALADIAEGFDRAMPGDQGSQAFREWADDTVAGLQDVESAAGDVADDLRTNLIENGLDPAQQKLNDLAIPMLAEAALHDATTAMAASLDAVGYAADGSRVSLEGVDLANLTASESGRLLDEQLRAVVAGLDAQAAAGAATGQSQEELTAKYAAGRDELVKQLTQMGLTEQQAYDLVTAYGAVPEAKATVFTADTSQAMSAIQALREEAGRVIQLRVDVNPSYDPSYTPVNIRRASGGILPGPPSSVDNMVIAAASGEFVVNAEQTRQHRTLLEAINAGRLPAYKDGGLVGAVPAVAQVPTQAARRVEVHAHNYGRRLTVADITQAVRAADLMEPVW